MMETWEDIVGYEGLYMVSDHGRVASLSKWVTRSRGSFLTKTRILKGSLKRPIKRYPEVTLTDKDGNIEHQFVHRLVMEAFLPNPENKRTVNHKDLNKSNNHLSNLEWATDAENLDHARKNGAMNQAKGERVTRAILTDSQVIEIKKMMRDGKTNSYIRRTFNVNRSLISHIRNGLTWKHVII